MKEDRRYEMYWFILKSDTFAILAIIKSDSFSVTVANICDTGFIENLYYLIDINTRKEKANIK